MVEHSLQFPYLRFAMVECGELLITCDMGSMTVWGRACRHPSTLREYIKFNSFETGTGKA